MGAASSKRRSKSVDVDGSLNVWGNSLALRIAKSVAQVAGVKEGDAVMIHAEPGRIVIDIPQQKGESLDEMLARFDPQLHGGEEMAFEPVGREAIE